MSSRDLAARSQGSGQPAQLADVLERVLDKGIVIAGDIKINLLDIELLTVKLRLLVASADKAREMGIDWWEGDPFLSRGGGGGDGDGALEQRLRRLEAAAGLGDKRADGDGA
jgi:gas vesicle protein GvpA/GvpJ/GvpM family